MLVDTHCHLASHRFGPGEVTALVDEARAAGVDRIVTISTDLQDARRNIEIAEAHPSVFATAGIHPTSVHEVDAADWLDQVRNMLTHAKVVAIGEAGMDFYHPAPAPLTEESYRARQAEFFRAQLDLAVELELPVVIHQRNSIDAILEIMEPYHGRVRAVFHCFSGPPEQARRLLALGHLVSFTGIVTYQNADDIRSAAREIPLDTFMVETDAPYLAPVPRKGKRCEPAHARLTAESIASLRAIPLAELAQATTRTAENFFDLPASP